MFETVSSLCFITTDSSIVRVIRESPWTHHRPSFSAAVVSPLKPVSEQQPQHSRFRHSDDALTTYLIYLPLLTQNAVRSPPLLYGYS